MIKTVLKAAVVFITGVILGLSLLLGVFLLPTEPMRENANESTLIFESSGTYPYMIQGYNGSILDNFTDSLMLNNAVTAKEASVVDRAMQVYRAQDDSDYVQSFIKYANTGVYENTDTYARYWHGYLVTLKPMLLLFNYSQIRLINVALFALLGLTACLLIWKRTSLKYGIGFIIALLFTVPIVIPFSLQFSTIMYITLITLICMLLFHEKLNKNNRYIYFFLAAGMVTSYMDYLTYPLAVLGVPMVMLMILSNGETLKKKIIKIVLLSVCFGIGYVGMWGAKWVIGSLLTGKDIIGNAMETVANRTGMEAVNVGEITVLDVFSKNLSMIGNLPFKIIAIATLLVEVMFIAVKGIPFKEAVVKAIPFLLVACMPFAWQIVASNHSFEHAWFTFRIYVITAFALITMLSSMFELKKKETRVIDKIKLLDKVTK